MSKNNHETTRGFIEISDWHFDIIKERYQDYLKNPEQVEDFDHALNEIEKDLASL